MAKTKVSEFDATASNNTDINSVNVAEGCPPSGINNAIREMASLLKKQEVGTDAMTSPDIDGGTIDGATIGASSASTGAFTTINASGNVTIADGADIITATAGASNFRAGVNAGNSITSGGQYNVVVGDEAGTALTTGDGNVAIGYEALKTEDANGQNVAIGYRALKLQDGGAEVANTAIGYLAGSNIDLGRENVLVGANVGDSLTHADYNVAIGNGSLGADVKGHKSTAIGYASLNAQSFSSSFDSHNTAVGYFSGVSITTGTQNTIIGSLAGDALTDSDYNVAIGMESLSTDTQGSRSTAIGKGTLKNQNFTSASDAYNVAVGYEAGNDITTGTLNTLVGALSGDELTTGITNVAYGFNSLGADTAGHRSTALGYNTLQSQNFSSSTNSNNVAVGYNAGAGNVTGASSTFVGESSGLSSTASFNTFFGANSGETITSGQKNTVIGRFNGNQSSLDIRTDDNIIVISDGDGIPAIVWDGSNNNLAVNAYVAVSDGNFHSRFGGGQSANNNACGFVFLSCGSDDDRTGLYWEQQGVVNTRMWIDNTGDLRVFSGNPTSNTGGTVVGTQTFTGTHIYKTDETDLKIGEAVCLVGQKIARVTDAKSKTCVGIYAGQSWKIQDSMGNACNDKDGWGHAVIALGDTRFHQTDSETVGVLVDGAVTEGDLLCTSSTSGKLTVQDDDIIHSYTVGKAMESGDGSAPIYSYIYSG